jgi:hypothetical protein
VSLGAEQHADIAAGAIDGLVSQVRKDGLPVVRMKCSDCGSQWVVECDVYPVDELMVEPKTAGPYVFTNGAEARRFVDESLLALQIFGCEVV